MYESSLYEMLTILPNGYNIKLRKYQLMKSGYNVV